MMLSIRNKLIALFLVISLIPISILGFLSQTYSSDALAAAKHLEFNNLIHQISQGIEKCIKMVETNLNILSHSEIVEKYMISPETSQSFLEDGLYATFESYIDSYGLSEVCILDSNGHELARQSTDDYEEIEVKYLLNDKWFKKLNKEGNQTKGLKTIETIKNTDKAVLKLGIPLQYKKYGFIKEKDKSLGFLIFTLNMERLASFIGKLDMQKKGGAYLLDGENLILGSKNGRLLGQPFSLNRNNLYFEKRAAIMNGLLHVVLVADKSEYLETVQKLKILIWIITACIALFIISLIPLLTIWLTNPIYRLRDDIIRVSSGDLDYSIAADTKDEIGFLAKAWAVPAVALYLTYKFSS